MMTRTGTEYFRRQRNSGIMRMVLCPMLVFCLSVSGLLAQTDTEFWFGAPKITEGHSQGGIPIYIRVASMSLPSNVTISIPSNPGFAPVNLSLAANEAQTVELSAGLTRAEVRDIIENSPYEGTVPLNKGIRIVSDNLITAYYEVGTVNNPDIFALKGRNALGTNFYVPFQNHFRNGNYSPQPFSSIVVVAIADNTQITFTPTRPVHPGRPADVPFTVVLNRGQTYAVGPDNMIAGAFPRQGQLPQNRLTGTRIVSDKPIAVTTADDSVDANPYAGCKDLIGDQIVPVSIIGTEYIAMRGRLNVNMRESFYITATDPGTDIFIDANPVPLITLDEGETYRYEFTQPRHHILATKPVYVYHVAGFGCEMGGAILPPVNVCTGSTQVSFTRSKGESFFMNILVYAGAEDGFILNGDPTLITAADFNPVPGTANWLAAEFEFTQAVIPVAVASLIQNTRDVFHLGIINGGPATGTMYGYFSDFNELEIRALVAGTTSNVLRTCFGIPVRLFASGGTTFSWEPQTYLDNPFSSTPLANPLTSMLYRVSVSGACNLADTATISVQVSTPVEAMFSFDEGSVCAPEDVTFYNSSTGGSNFRWYVNNILQDMSLAPVNFTHRFENNTNAPVDYTIALVVRNDDGCSDQLGRTITVYPAINSDFSADQQAGCHPLPVEFTNLSSGNTDRWYWDFGDGASSVDENPVHIFSNLSSPDDTVYRVSLIATSPYFCRDTSVMDITVSPFIEAGFTFDQPSGCSPWEVLISNESIGADTYHWDFGDGNTSSNSGPSFTHIFENPGNSTVNYTIRLRVINDEGCEDIIEREVTVYPDVTAGFTATPAEGCTPLSVDFTNTSTGATGYYWDFGDGAGSSGTDPSHIYPANLTGSDITYTVMLVAVSDHLCTDTSYFDITVHPYIEADFTIDNVEGCHPLTVTINNNSTGADLYRWHFGDGSPVGTSGSSSFSHTYLNTGFSDVSYELKLVIENQQGCKDSISRQITVYPEITANFIPSDSEGCEPLLINFADMSKNAAQYSWDFGDGTGSAQPSLSHTFTNTGTGPVIRNVSLTTTSANGQCTATNSWNITVHGRVAADFEIDRETGCNPYEVTFINHSTGGENYIWDFGDGQSYNTVSADPFTHLFVNPGYAATEEFNVRLLVENYAGCTSEMTKSISVYPDITAAFSVNAAEGCHPLSVSFLNQTEGGLTFFWDFGDGSTSSLRDPVHLFTNTGTQDSIYRVRMITTASNNECRDSFFMDIRVHPYVKADFSLSENIDCNPFNPVIVNTSLNASVFFWDFGDGTDSITHTTDAFSRSFVNNSYSDAETFNITLRAENFAGCSGEISRTLSVYPAINAMFEADSETGCHPLTVNFTDLSQGAFYHRWDFGDGSLSSLQNPVHTFTNTGASDSIYRVRLLTRAENNVCADSFFIEIRVHPFVKSEFSIPESVSCTPFELEINNSSVGAEQFRWDFGDGTDTVTFNTGSFIRTFYNPGHSVTGSYIIQMTAENYAGCTDQSERTVYVYHDIQADFNSSIIEGCHPLEVSFENLTTGGNRYEWSFGDGSSSDLHSPMHVFRNTGNTPLTREVRLHAWSENYCHSDHTVNITIHPNPRARFEIDNTANCPPFDLEIVNTSIDADRYRWVFGDGHSAETVSSTPFYHTYNNEEDETKTYTLRLFAESDFGCSDSASQSVSVYPNTVADFTSVTEGCSPLQVSFQNNSVRAFNYLWNFGDGLGIGIRSPDHVYFNNTFSDTSYYVSLTVVSEYGCTDSNGYNISVYPQPVAEFTVDPVQQEYPSVSVDIVNATNQGNWSYLWNFDDGNTSALREPGSHAFGDWGEYNIRLRVWNDNCADSASHRIFIRPPQPLAAFDLPDPGCEPHTVLFRNNSIYGRSYYWDFDDGNTSREIEPLHTYREYGLYNVRLTVTGDGGEDFIYRRVEVFRKPIVDFKVSPQTVLLPDEEIKLFNMSEFGERYYWDFGDGNFSSEKNPGHLYTEMGEYDISLYVWTIHECTDEMHLPKAVKVIGSGEIVFPNAFRPGHSGPSGGYYDPADPTNNTIFRPYWDGVTEYTLRIYNRWGEFLYESNDVMKGWDGYYNGQLSKQDVYVWKVWVSFTNGTSLVKAGDVTLLR